MHNKMKAKEVAAILEEFAPGSFQESWDNAGFCIGSPEQEVTGVLLGLDCTESLLDEAVACGANLIITHHPMIFQGLKKIHPDDNVGRLVYKAIQHNLVVYSAHTNADKVFGGVSDWMMDRLGLTDCQILDPEVGVQDASGRPVGLGMVGNWAEPVAPEAFLERVKTAFGTPCLRASAPLNRPIRRVAVCGGSGTSLLAAARRAGADAFLCGDVSYHHFFTDEQLWLVDVGHFESEIGIVDRFFTILQEKISNFAVRKTAKTNNPVYYY
jgi:dinuclear metal center YbgI/SA1388 family protein